MLHKREQQAMAHVIGHPRTACTPNWFTINLPQLPSLCTLPLASPVASWRTASWACIILSIIAHNLRDIWKSSFHSPSQNFFRTTLFFQHLQFLPSSKTSLSVVHGAIEILLTNQRAGSLLHDLYATAWFHARVAAKSCNKVQDRHDYTEEQEKGGGNSSAQTDLCYSILICTQPHVNWNNRGIFIFIGYANRWMESLNKGT